MAAVAGDIAFIINRCGPPISWDETILFEIENDLRIEGVDPHVIDEALEIQVRRWKYVIDTAGDGTLATGVEYDAINTALAALRRDLGPAASMLS